MPKTYNIRWSAKDTKQLSGKVRTFNTKRTKLIKLVPELEDILPPKANVSELRSSITTRKDFNKVIARLDRFLVKGAEDTITTEGGVVTTKYQLNELKIQQRTINQYRASQRKKADVSTERGTMGAINKMNLRPKTLKVEKASKEMWDSLVKSYERQSMDTYYNERDEIYKKNYLTALKNVFGDIDNDVIETVEGMEAKDVVDMFYYDPNLQIDFLYPVDDESTADSLRFYKQTLNEYLSQMKT